MKVYANPTTIIQKFDLNGDGNLDYNEFKNMITPKDTRYHIHDDYYGGRGLRNIHGSPSSLRSREHEASNPDFIKHQHISWEDDLKEILFTISNADDLL